MNQALDINIFTVEDENSNVSKLNTTLLDIVSQSAFCDCQSMPLKNYFSDLVSRARFSIESTYDKFMNVVNIELRPSKTFLEFLDKTPYVDTARMRAEVPEGLKVPYLNYIAVLMPAQERANAVMTDVLEPFADYISKLISDEKFRQQAGHHIKQFKDLEPSYNRTVSEFSNCFTKGSYNASAAFSEVVSRNADWIKVYEQTKQLKVLVQAFPAANLTKRLNEIYEMLDVVNKLINSDGFNGVEKNVTKLLSVGIYQIAKEVELASLTTFRTKTFITCINTTIENAEGINKEINDLNKELR